MRLQHKITLSNGQIMVVEESSGGLHIASEFQGEIDYYICTITADGVLVMPNSSDAVEALATKLKPDSKPPDEQLASIKEQAAVDKQRIKLLNELYNENAELISHACNWVVDGWGLDNDDFRKEQAPEQIAAALLMEARTQDGCVERGESVAEYPERLRILAVQILAICIPWTDALSLQLRKA